MRSFTTSLILASALAIASGCSSKKEDAAATPAADEGPSAPVAAAASGSRLKAKFLSGAGAREHAGWHDSQRNEDCTFQPAESGHIRCLPETLTASQSGTFSDPACQIPTATAAATCGADVKYAIAYRPTNTCAQAASEIRKVVDVAGPRYAQNGVGACTQQLSVRPGQPASVALGDVVPWTAFVEASETNVPGTTVTERVLVATDGARQHVGFRDDKLGTNCSFQLISDGFTRCVPEATAGPVLYGDSDCTRPLLVNDYTSQQGGCTTKAPTNNWLEPPNETCSGLRAVYSLRDYSGPAAGDGYDVYDWQTSNPGSSPSATGPVTTCTSGGTLASGNSTNRRAIAANITTSLPHVPRVSTGSGRLVPAFVWPAGLETTLVPGWHDTERDVDCTFTLASDGKMRCLPVTATATLFFTDDKCKSASLVAVQNEPDCIGKSRFARTVSATCPPKTTVYALGTTGRNLASASYSTVPGQCAKVGGANAAHDATLVDPTQFVEGVPSVE